MLYIVVWRDDSKRSMVQFKTFRNFDNAREFCRLSVNECELYTCGGGLLMVREFVMGQDE